MSEVKIAAIIPARMASSRFPGKPLIEIEGLHRIEHVLSRTLMYRGFSDVLVSTCEKEIQETDLLITFQDFLQMNRLCSYG